MRVGTLLRILAALHATQAAAESAQGQAPEAPLRRLRVCNAYADQAPAEIFEDGRQRLTPQAEPLAYGACRDWSLPLRAGAKLEFKIGTVASGVFKMYEQPANDAVLLLVVRRRDARSATVSFTSHVFASREGPQVAVIDAYQGQKQATPFLSGEPRSRREELRYNSVVAIGEGQYQVELVGEGGEPLLSGGLAAAPGESYVLLRTGSGQAIGGRSFPEDLVVFPKSETKSAAPVGSGAQRQGRWPFLEAVAGLLITAAQLA